MRLYTTLLLLILLPFQWQAQSMQCDSIMLTDGSTLLAQIKGETKNHFSYVLCCEVCNAYRKISKKKIDRVILTTETEEILKIKAQKESDNTKMPIDYSRLYGNIELGGASLLGSANLEYQFLKDIGVRLGFGYGFDKPMVNGSFFLKFGKKHQFVPAAGVTSYLGNPEIGYTGFLGYQLNYGKKANFSLLSSKGYFRISPGVLIFPGDPWYPVLPWVAVTFGFNFSNL